MKIIIQISKLACVFSMIYLLATSCEDLMGDFLDKPPGVDVTEDTVFSTQINAEKFLMGIYRHGMYTDMPIMYQNDGRDAPFAAYCDEAEAAGWWVTSHAYNVAWTNPNDYTGDAGLWEARWRAIRSVNIFLDRINGVPDASPEYKKQAKGQALFIRGLCYFEMFKRYGGVPIVDNRFDLSDPENLKVPRATIEATVDFIIRDADAAAALLPDSWSSNYAGKATKGAALMLKSRTLLYAASPLTNTASPPLSLPGDDHLLICYGNTDLNRWKLAANAAKDVLDWAPGAGVHLLTGSNRSYQDVWEVPDNEEIIMTIKAWGPQSVASNLWGRMFNFYHTGNSATMVTQNFVEKYEKKDGTPQIWSPTGGNNLNQMYAELDPRFGQSVAYNGLYWNPDFPELRMYEDAPEPNQLTNLKTGYWLKKFIPAALNRTTPAIGVWNLYRLAEAYLNYAEALNEFEGPTPEAYAAVKTVRDRVGMPPFPAGLTQEQFRERIRNERSVELAFEEHRLWDIMRWVIAEQEGVMQGDFRGIKIYRDGADFRYTMHVFEQRQWKAGMYRIPFYQTEINKGYLVQNPGF